ncbi:MAG: hypothetical protein AB4368_02100 [Xenococcaceae cyanobacterium]
MTDFFCVSSVGLLNVGFNALKSRTYQGGRPVKDMKRLFHKEVIVNDETLISTETIKIPGFIGIANDVEVKDSQEKIVSGHDDIIQFLDRDGLLICTYQYNKDRYGQVIDLRYPPNEIEKFELMEAFIKNEGSHTGAIVPAISNGKKAFASFDEPDAYHGGLYGEEGSIAVAQRLLFPDFVSKEQARGYKNSIICWMALMNPVAEFPQNDFNGGDPTRVCDRATLKQFMKNCALASLGSNDAIEFLNNLKNKTYCAEFIYIALNTPVYPFNKTGLTLLLDGDETNAIKILELQKRQNSKRANLLSKMSKNPQFKNFKIQMPVVSEELPPLDRLMAEQGKGIELNSIPFPPFKLSQVLRRAFRTLLPRQNTGNEIKIVEAQTRLLENLEPLILKQLNISVAPPTSSQTNASIPENPLTPQNDTLLKEDDPKVIAVRQFIAFVKEQVQKNYSNYMEFDRAIDRIMEKADELIGADNLTYFVPPRIYVDLGQNDGDSNLPEGWGFRLETIGALIHRGVIKNI